MVGEQGRTLAFSFALSILFIPGISGAATAPRWALAAVVLPLLLRSVKFTAAHLCGLAFFCYAALSFTWSPNVWDGLEALIELVVIAEAFWLGSQLESIQSVVIGFGLGMWISSAVMLFGLNVPSVTDNAGLFANSNAMGEIAGLVLVCALASRLWWLVPGILPAFVLAHSRGAFAAVGAAALFWLWGKSRLAAAGLGLAALGALVYAAQTPSAQQRFDMWAVVLPHLSLMGHGLGSFYGLYPLYALSLVERPEHLHNDWLEMIFETGFFGLVSCCGFALLWFRAKAGMVKFILSCFAIESLFGFPLHMAATAVLGGIVAGYAVRGGHGLCDMLDAWRVSLCGGHEGNYGGKSHWLHAGGGFGVPAQPAVPQVVRVMAG